MAGDVIEMSSVKAQLGQACMAAAAAELATMQAVKPLVDQIAADSAAGKLATPEEYLNAFSHLLKPAPTATRSPGNNTQQRNSIMINLTPPPAPPVTGNAELDRVFAWIALATDPQACAARLAEIQSAHANASEVIKSADEINAGHAKERAALKAERAAHDADIKRRREAFERECQDRDHAIDQRAAETAKLNEKAQAKLAGAERLRLEAEQRLEKIKAAAA